MSSFLQKSLQLYNLLKVAKDDISEVASVAVCNDDSILMGKRRDNERWTLPGGHLDQGEDKFEGAVRELFEEAGIKVDKDDLKYLGSEDVTTFSGKKKRIHAFKYHYDGERPTTKNDPDKEVYKWEWIDCKDGLPEDVEEMLHSPKNLVLTKLKVLKKSEELNKAETPVLDNDHVALHWMKSAYGDHYHPDDVEDYARSLGMRGHENWEIKKIPISSIDTHHSGHDKSDEFIKEYADQAKKGSPFPPVILEPHPQADQHPAFAGRFRTIDGQHRVKAAGSLGHTHIDAYVPMQKPQLGKSDYGPKGANLYSQPDNARRKETRTGEVAGAGPNKEVRFAGPTANQQAESQAKHWKQQSKKNPVKIYTPHEIAKLKTHLESRANKLKASETLEKPYRSDAQRKWAHTDAGTKALGGESAVHEWDKATTGKRLPEHVEKTTENVAIPAQPSWQSSYMQYQTQSAPKPKSVHQDPLEAMMHSMMESGKLIHHPKRGIVEHRRIQQHGDNAPLMRAEEGALKLEHYGKVPGLRSIEPTFHGTSGVKSQEYKHGMPATPVSYYYRHGTEPEDIVRQGANSKYHVTLEPHHKIYDLASDADGLVAGSVKSNGGAWNRDSILGDIKSAGYHGFHNSSSALPNIVALFHPAKPNKEEAL